MGGTDSDGVGKLIDRVGRVTRGLQFVGGLSPAQWAALRYVGCANRYSRNPSSLPGFLGSTKGTISQTLIALEGKGYVRRLRGNSDRRAVRLDITPAGEAMLLDDTLYRIDAVVASAPAPSRFSVLVRSRSHRISDRLSSTFTVTSGMVCMALRQKPWVSTRTSRSLVATTVAMRWVAPRKPISPNTSPLPKLAMVYSTPSPSPRTSTVPAKHHEHLVGDVAGADDRVAGLAAQLRAEGEETFGLVLAQPVEEGDARGRRFVQTLGQELPERILVHRRVADGVAELAGEPDRRVLIVFELAGEGD